MSEARWLDTIQALLVKAHDKSVTPEESETYRAKALELAAKYSLEEALTAPRNGERAEPVMREFYLYPDDDDGTGYVGLRGTASLLMSIAFSLRCQTVEMGMDQCGGIIAVYGYPDDVEAVGILYAQLLLQLADAILKADIPPGKKAGPFKTGIIRGFTAEVCRRLEPPPETTRAGTGVALRSQFDEIRRRVLEDNPDWEPFRQKRPVISSKGIAAGAAAGARADIGQKSARAPGAERSLR